MTQQESHMIGPGGEGAGPGGLGRGGVGFGFGGGVLTWWGWERGREWCATARSAPGSGSIRGPIAREAPPRAYDLAAKPF